MADIRINALATTAASTASDDFIAVDGSANGTRKLNAYSPTFGGNVTASGNLTVSGGTITGGTSGMSLASGGTNQSVTLTPNGTGATIAASSGADSVPALGAAGGRFRISTSGFGMLMGSDSTGAGWIQQQRVDGTATSYPLWLQPNGGNVLLGGTIDGGQKLQVSGTAYISSTTTIAGDVNINRGASDTYVSLVTSGTTASQYILFEDSGGASGSIAYTHSTNALAFKTNGSNALTLDSSQNATFAKSITASGPLTLSSSTQGNANFYAISTSASANFGALYEADARTQSANARWNWGTGSTDGGAAADSFRIRERVTGVNTLVISAVTGNATFAGSLTTSAPTGGAGAWELGVANNVSPTAPNRTITIEIGGTVYYLHAKTTND